MHLFWLDISALVLSSLLTLSLTLMVVGVNPTALLNLSFGFFILLQGAWAVFALLMRLSLWLNIGTPLVYGEWASLMLVLSTPFLFIFTIHYLAISKVIQRRLFYLTAFGGILLIIVVAALLLFPHKLMSEPVLQSNGTVSMRILPEGIGTALFPFIFLIGSLILFMIKRHKIKEYYLPGYVLVFTAGYISGGLLDIPLPVLSITNLLSVSILGYGVVRKQLFNPLREINIHLEECIRLRTEELNQAYTEVEKRVEERTGELTAALSRYKQSEDTLRESEEKFRNLADESPNMIFINKQGKVVYANRKCEELMGYTREEFYAVSFDFRSLVAPECIQLMEINFKKHQASEDVKPCECSLLTKSGKMLEAILTTRLIHYEGEMAILGIITDISPQKRTERLLMNLNEVALSLMHCLTPREVWSVTGRSFQKQNLCCCILEKLRETTAFQLHYLSLKNTTGTFDGRITELFISEDGKQLSLSLATLFKLDTFLESKQPFFRQQAFLPPEKQQDDVSNVNGFPVVSSDFSLEMSVWQFFTQPNILFLPLSHEFETFGMLMIQSEELMPEDVPAYTAFSFQLAAAWHKSTLLIELTRNIDELKLAQKELLHSQKMEAIGRLAGNVAHDFNNILTVINSYSQLLYVSLKDNEQALSDIREIRNATAQAGQLTNQLLTLCRKKDIQPVVLDVNHIIIDMMKMLEHFLGEQIQLKTKLCMQQAMIKVDPGQIEQILLNLTINARDALPQGGQVIITSELVDWSREGDGYPQTSLDLYLYPGVYVKLVISDNGQGMDRETQSHIFEPFFTTKTAGHGIGLGLAIVYSVIKQNNGYINVTSAPGQGTTFSIYFPYYDA